MIVTRQSSWAAAAAAAAAARARRHPLPFGLEPRRGLRHHRPRSPSRARVAAPPPSRLRPPSHYLFACLVLGFLFGGGGGGGCGAQFVNTFASVFYIAFFKKVVETAGCIGPGGCLDELGTQVSSLFISGGLTSLMLQVGSSDDVSRKDGSSEPLPGNHREPHAAGASSCRAVFCVPHNACCPAGDAAWFEVRGGPPS